MSKPTGRKPKHIPRNLHCAHCGQPFANLAAWQWHRRGTLAARRCLTEAEMRRVGLRKRPRNGQWFRATPEWVAEMRALKKRVHDQHRGA